MFTSLPRNLTQKEVVNEKGQKYFMPGRNLPCESFRQFNTEGSEKREYLFHKSAAVNDDSSVSVEAKLGNYTNLQLAHQSLNIDDIARDILYLRNRMYEDKDTLGKLDTKVDMVMDVLSDTSAIKEQLIASTAKLEGRLQVLESLLKTVTQR